MANEGISLGTQIMHCEEQSEFPTTRHTFVPEGSLARLISKEAIRWELEVDYEGRAEDLDKLVEFIHSRARKLFAITTTYMALDGSLLRSIMKLFKDAPNGGFTDENLPVKPKQGADHVLASLNGPRRRPLWTEPRINVFYTSQWKVLAPVLSVATESQYNHDFERGCILPFTKRYEAESDWGSFGQVCKYGIHPDHLVDPEHGVPYEYVAVKQIQPRNEKDRQAMIKGWEQEARILQKMNSLRQKHIVRFLTAFRHGDKGREDHYLMFEWADGGNLLNLWKLNKPLTPGLVKASVKQLLGLARALYHAHYPETGPKFRHGDLKPANILWFKDNDELGTLKIADWGLAKEHNVETELRTNKTSTEYGTRRYEPPEEETGDGVRLPGGDGVSPATLAVAHPGKPRGKRRSRLYDVWAMGCILLEFIVWMLYGPRGLRRFNKSIRSEHSETTPFYQTTAEPSLTTGKGNKVARVHDAAMQWMDHMAKDSRCQAGKTALGDLLELVRTRLLVVKMPNRLGMLQDLSLSNPTLQPGRPYPAHSGVTTPPSTAADSLSPSRSNIPGVVIHPAEPDELPPLPEPVLPPSPESVGGSGDRGEAGRGRALSDELVKRIEEIDRKGEADDANYWLPEMSEQPTLPPGFEGSDEDEGQGSDAEATAQSTQLCELPRRRPSTTTATATTTTTTTTTGGLIVPQQERIDYGSAELDNTWTRLVDNQFALEVLASIQKRLGPSGLPSKPPATTKLCRACRSFRDGLWKPAFSQTYQLSDLERAAKEDSCNLCGLFWRTCHATRGSSVTVEREGSFLKMNSMVEPALSILRSPDLSTRVDSTIQVGFPNLDDAPVNMQFEIIRNWLSHCNKHHNCHPKTAQYLLPTRLIAVGSSFDTEVRLIETNPATPTRVDSPVSMYACSPLESSSSPPPQPPRWLALSHQWGRPPHFCTTPSNLASHLKGIPLSTLPATFRDAVHVTRALDCPYLWIDSLCIVQGSGGDFDAEAKRMEQVYSGAWCVLAVSREREGGGGEGFLYGGKGGRGGPRRRMKGREYVALKGDGAAPGQFYICETVDDFGGHVLDGELCKRGWVLQERALARRTVFFTEWQTYWECGEGVRCETGIVMKNKLAAFLGDSNFPQILMDARQGEKILRCQDLYKRYSRLALTNAYDRPLAIDGLQSRILSALNSRGGFGVLDEGVHKRGLLRRSLLWYRDPETPRLERIVFPRHRALSAVPSWSWMAYTGGIDYITPDFDRVEWADLQSPWSGADQPAENITLVAEAREYDASKATQGEAMLVFDNPEQSLPTGASCVVLGTHKGSLQRSYVLLVRETAQRDGKGRRICERVGAGYMPAKCVGGRGEKVTIR